MKKCKHYFGLSVECSSADHYGIVIICSKCGKAYTYDSDWQIKELGCIQ